MNPELNVYKTTRINNLKNIYNVNYKRIVQYYNQLISNVSRSRIANKPAQIKKLTNECNQAILSLKQKLDADILAIQNITPVVIPPFQNKKALLIGINYIGTPYELNGCINDVESIKTRLITTSGFANDKITTLTDNTPVKPTRNNIINELFIKN